MTEMKEWLVSINHDGRMLRFSAAELPLSVGGSDADDIQVADARGAVQIGMLDGVFFVQSLKGARNVRVAGAQLAGSQRLRDGDEIAIDTARLRCQITDGRLAIEVLAQLTAGDTAPPDLEDLVTATQSSNELAIKPVEFRVGASATDQTSGFAPSKAMMAAGTAFIVLAVLGWFAFTAKSVAIISNPPAQEIALPDTFFKFRIGERFLLRTGDHRVTAQVEGYYPVDARIDVGRAPDQTVELPLEKLPGLVTITARPEQGVSVYLDGAPIGIAPLEDLEIPAGQHELEFRLDRHSSELVSIDVRGTNIRQAVSATLEPNWAPVTVMSEPAGADVLIDGELVGVSPLETELEGGSYDIELRLRGHNAWRDRLEVAANVPLTLPTVTMQQADGRVRLVSEPEDAAVSVNDEFAGRTPLDLRLRPGPTHRIVLTKPGFETVSTELTVAADSGRTVELTLPAQYGEVDISSDPAAAEIWVDDELTGTTPSRLTLSSLPHSIEVRLDGYAAQSAELTPRPGVEHVLEFELELLDDVTGGGYRRVVETSLGQRLQIVSAGEMTMGTSRREVGRRSNEVLRPVQLSQAFYLGMTEVTNAEFRAFQPDHDSGEFGGESLNGDDQPVVNVSWAEVAQYLNWLSISDGLQPVYEEGPTGWRAVRPLRSGYRLPTEAEWAWAARFAGREQAETYPWGSGVTPPDRSGNYADISAAKILPTSLQTYNDAFATTAPVESFEPDTNGFHDLGGNVAEWVQDFYGLDILESQEVTVDPLGPESGEYHVVRGSSWRSATVADLRIAARNYSSRGRDDLGFRIARNLE